MYSWNTGRLFICYYLKIRMKIKNPIRKSRKRAFQKELILLILFAVSVTLFRIDPYGRSQVAGGVTAEEPLLRNVRFIPF